MNGVKPTEEVGNATSMDTTNNNNASNNNSNSSNTEYENEKSPEPTPEPENSLSGDHAMYDGGMYDPGPSPDPPVAASAQPEANGHGHHDDEHQHHHGNGNGNTNNIDNTKEESKQKEVPPHTTSNQHQSQSQNASASSKQSSEIDKIIAALRSLKRSVNRGCINIACEAVEKICIQTRSIFQSESALLEIDAPMKIVGDIHGQYFDLLRLFELGGFPNEADSRYIFLGDYVDRGSHSLEVILLLFCYKIKMRNDFYLLRGNHECGSINRIYGFFDECKRRFPDGGIRLWKTFTDVFNYLPVAAIIDEKIFCMHGGLSPQIMKRNSLQQIANIKRPTDVPDRGLLCDLLWADPDPYIDTWGPNDRGVSYTFGAAVLNQFLTIHDMDLICRAHQVVEDGYEFFGDRTLVTIFSAPNYCNEFDNAGAIMSVDDTLMCSFHVLKPNYKRKTRFYQ